jgi:hypothetical protein
MNKITRILASALCLVAGAVSAEPVTLSASQLDNVSAGFYVYTGAAQAGAQAGALSNLLGLSGSQTDVVVDPNGAVPTVTGVAQSGAIAVSTYNPLTPTVNGAVAVSAAASASVLF